MAQQRMTTYTWLILLGATFRIPVRTLQRPKEEGGWGFPIIGAHYRTLLYSRIQMLGKGRNRPCGDVQLVAYWHSCGPLM
jgi:hypothetical protein